MTLSLALVCEGPSDPGVACGLADRLLTEFDWIADSLDAFREWRGLRRTDPYLAWARVKQLAAERNIRLRGKFDGFPISPDELTGRKALLLFLDDAVADPPDAVLLIRDDDRQSDRRIGLERARQAVP